MTGSATDRRGLYLAVLLALVGVRFGWLPLHDWREATADRVHALEQAVQRKGALAGAAAEVEADLERSYRALDQVSQLYFPALENPQALQLLLQQHLEDLAADEEVPLTRVDWAAPSEGDVTKASVRIDATLSYGSLARFLSAVEQEKPLLYVESLRIFRRPDARGVNVTLEVSAYGLGRSPRQGSP